MRNIWTIARREYWTNLRRPAFLFAAFGTPLLIGLIMFLMMDVTVASETSMEGLGEVGYVDLAGVIADVEAPFTAYADEAAAQEALEIGRIGAYFVLPPDYLASGDVTIYSRQNTPQALQGAIRRLLRVNLGAEIGEDVLIERLEHPVSLTIRAQDRNRDLQEEAAPGLVMLPIIFALIYFISAQTTSSYLMSSVVEEKSSRVIEILITTVTPLQLLFGKIIGLGALGLTQLLIWLVAGGLLLNLGQQVPFLSGMELPPDLIVFSVVYFVLGYMLFAGVLAGVGATSNTEQESRQFAGIFSLISVVPFFFITSFLFDPNGPVPVILTLFPFTAPLTAIIRLSLGGLPAVQLAASLLILLVTVVVVIWMSARVFRWSLLLYGKRPTPRELWRVIRGRPVTAIGTTAQE